MDTQQIAAGLRSQHRIFFSSPDSVLTQAADALDDYAATMAELRKENEMLRAVLAQPAPALTVERIEKARAALYNMDNYARMLGAVSPDSQYKVLEQFINDAAAILQAAQPVSKQ